MGYNTRHYLSWNTDDDIVKYYVRGYLTEKDVMGFCIDEYGECENECKWYDSGDHMLHLSNKFPDVLFTLHGEGEEQGDVWTNHYLGGKVQRCRAELVLNDNFDETKLMEAVTK